MGFNVAFAHGDMAFIIVGDEDVAFIDRILF